MISILGSILGAGLKWALSYFMPSKDEKLGQLEQKTADLEASNEALANRPITDNDLINQLRSKADNERKDIR